jgi:hypothetical protein
MAVQPKGARDFFNLDRCLRANRQRPHASPMGWLPGSGALSEMMRREHDD